jgi:hypothetical protein
VLLLQKETIMRRFVTILGLALAAYALIPTAAQAQVIVVQPGRTYVAPIVVAPPVVQTYYAPSVTYSSSASYSYYPPAVTYSYSASSVPGVVTYSAPAAVVAPAGIITTRTYYGYGILRPRGYYSQSYYTPILP